MMIQEQVKQQTRARIPTPFGEFQLCYYVNSIDDKEHLALVYGDPGTRTDVLVRIHSECFTGDVLGSLRCDCGSQLQRAMQLIAAEGAGVIIYLRQEGRGIGLLDKLRAYNLQDEGYDTVDANLMLGHQPDARDYTVAALILRDLGVHSLRLLTNNPDKIENLQALGVIIKQRVPLIAQINPENELYLKTKVEKMRHLLELNGNGAKKAKGGSGRPQVTLSYAQSLDGAITSQPGKPTSISGPNSLKMTHELRAQHDAILVGIGTVLADDPSLTVRLVDGQHPQPVVVDTRLRFPETARLWDHPRKPWIATTVTADSSRQRRLHTKGATLLALPAMPDGRVSLTALLDQLGQMGVHRLMVEGGSAIITSFLSAQLVDRLVITIAPIMLGGLPAVAHLNGQGFPRLHNLEYRWLGDDVVVMGDVLRSQPVEHVV